MYDVLVIGGGVAGVSCALVLGSAKNKPYALEKKVGILVHQKNSNLQEAVINNAYGIAPGKHGSELLVDSLSHLSNAYPHVDQIAGEKVLSVSGSYPEFTVTTNKNSYQTRCIVVAMGWANTFNIEGLNQYIEPHGKSLVEKNRIQLKNNDQNVAPGLFVAGTLAGWRSQLSIAAGSGASVATDILSYWNNGVNSQSHDSLKK